MFAIATPHGNNIQYMAASENDRSLWRYPLAALWDAKQHPASAKRKPYNHWNINTPISSHKHPCPPNLQSVVEEGGVLYRRGYLEGHGDLGSRLIIRITRVTSPLILQVRVPIINRKCQGLGRMCSIGGHEVDWNISILLNPG